MKNFYQTLIQWFSICGPWPIGGPQKYFAVGHRAFWIEKVVFARWAVYSLTLSESMQKVAVNGKLTCFFVVVFFEIDWKYIKKGVLWGKDLFFFRRSPDFDRKPSQSNSRLMKIWIKFVDLCFKLPKKGPLQNPGYAAAQDSGKLQLSNTLRVDLGKFSKWKWASVRKRLGTTVLISVKFRSTTRKWTTLGKNCVMSRFYKLT